MADAPDPDAASRYALRRTPRCPRPAPDHGGASLDPAGQLPDGPWPMSVPAARISLLVAGKRRLCSGGRAVGPTSAPREVLPKTTLAP